MVTRCNMKLFEITSKMLTDGKLRYPAQLNFQFLFLSKNFPKKCRDFVGLYEQVIYSYNMWPTVKE